MKKHLQKYLEFRNSVDKRCVELWDTHNKNMQCKAGCSSCCQSFKILPVEFEYIKSKLREDKTVKTNPNHKKEACKFLVDNKCAIYDHRPIICRSHGFPLVRLNEELEEYEVSFCHLNFKGYPLESFSSSNVYFEDKFNSQLFQINKGFIDDDKTKGDFDSGQLIPLNDMDVD